MLLELVTPGGNALRASFVTGSRKFNSQLNSKRKEVPTCPQ